MGSNMESCDLKRQLVYLPFDRKISMPSVGSHTGKCVTTSNNEKKKQNVLEKQTALITPSQCSSRSGKKIIVHGSHLYWYKEGTRAEVFFFLNIRVNALLFPACPVESRKQMYGKSWGGNLVKNRLGRKITSMVMVYSPLLLWWNLKVNML